MLVIQQNCGNKYECIISAFEVALGLNTGVVCIQKLFLEKKTLAYTELNIHW